METGKFLTSVTSSATRKVPKTPVRGHTSALLFFGGAAAKDERYRPLLLRRDDTSFSSGSKDLIKHQQELDETDFIWMF